ncbi:hypothetical protein RJ639_034906 [Escallonia herrerae]|uniref:Uncharacterized protein n=1 Tax=Escallonia herrerae TaxID=1293975 RepID=A0AA88WRV9_9ASTE|nr:hypothetical protein RJ639_034906 [Escallonia herrerae]
MEAAKKDEGPFLKTQDNISGSSNLPLAGLISDRFFIELNESSSILTAAEIRNKDRSVLPVDSTVPYSGVLGPLEQSKSSERLFFEPYESSSVLAAAILPYKDCLAVTVGSADPCADFRVAMESMVEGYGPEDSERLEELMDHLEHGLSKIDVWVVGILDDGDAVADFRARADGLRAVRVVFVLGGRGGTGWCVDVEGECGGSVVFIIIDGAATT